jgi:hypothetical protein
MNIKAFSALVICLVSSQAFAQMDVIRSVPGYSPETQKESQLKWGLGVLKDSAGMAGGAIACRNKELEADSWRVFHATLRSLTKNGILKKEDVPYVKEMNVRTAAQAKAGFNKQNKITCSDLPDAWLGMKDELGLN